MVFASPFFLAYSQPWCLLALLSQYPCYRGLFRVSWTNIGSTLTCAGLAVLQPSFGNNRIKHVLVIKPVSLYTWFNSPLVVLLSSRGSFALSYGRQKCKFEPVLVNGTGLVSA